MLSLESDLWSELPHAYGLASDIPALLTQLAEFPASSGNDDPWHSLWSALAHQGDVYAASFAAVPHVINILATFSSKAGAVYFQFPAWVEICRKNKSIEVPQALAPAYFQSLSQLPNLVALASSREWDAEFLQCALSAIAAVKGDAKIAEAVQELSPEIAVEFMEWFYER